MGNPNEQTTIVNNSVVPQGMTTTHESLQGRTAGLYPQVSPAQATGYGGTAGVHPQQGNVHQPQVHYTGLQIPSYVAAQPVENPNFKVSGKCIKLLALHFLYLRDQICCN